ncbi:hypothetical protein ACWF94_39055 [Streptomyces sp. NPDC055078]
MTDAHLVTVTVTVTVTGDGWHFAEHGPTRPDDLALAGAALTHGDTGQWLR